MAGVEVNSAVLWLPSRFIMSDLEKQIKMTPAAYKQLSRAKLELFGAESVRYSDVVEALANQVLEGENNDE